MRKIGLLVIALILALGALGVGYASWSQAMYVDGTVNMGYIAAEYYDFIAPTDPYAEVNPVINGTGATIPNATTLLSDKLTINIEDAYPSYSGIVQFRLINTGTVPFFLEDLEDSDITVRDPWGNIVTDVIKITDAAEDPDSWSSIIVEPSPYTNVSATYKIQISVPGGQDALDYVDPVQNMNYTIEINLTARQNIIP
jgi:hypothetical protein